MSRVLWEDGQLLKAEHFHLQQDLLQKHSVRAGLIFSHYQNGFINLGIDLDLLNNNVLSFTSLLLQGYKQNLFILEYNLSLEKFNLLDLPEDKENVDFYLNITFDNNILTKENDIPIQNYKGLISLDLNGSIVHSYKIISLCKDNDGWNINYNKRPALIRLPIQYFIYDLNVIESYIIKLLKKLKFLVKSNSDVITLNFEIKALRSFLSLQSHYRDSIDFDILIEKILRINLAIKGIGAQENIVEGNVNGIHDQYNFLVNEFCCLVKGFSGTKVKAISLKHNNGIYETPIIEDNLFKSTNIYLMCEDLISIDSSGKIFSPVDYESIMTKFTSGCNVSALSKNEIETMDSNFKSGVKINQNCDVWKNILDSKVLYFRSFGKPNENLKLSLIFD